MGFVADHGAVLSTGRSVAPWVSGKGSTRIYAVSAKLDRLVDFVAEDQPSKPNPEIVGSLWALWPIFGLCKSP